MNQVTLGGERLGSGNKMKVEMHGFERSTHDIGYIWRSTMSAGTLVPFMKELALSGDTFDIHLNCDIKTHPTIGPLFGSYKVQLDVFLAPLRLYNSALHNNALGIGMKMNAVKFPKMELLASVVYGNTTDIDNAQVNPSCLLSYLGIRGVGIVNPVEGLSEPQYRKFNAVPLLAYWDIYKNYYANKQEEIGYVIAQELYTINETVTVFTVNGNMLAAPGANNLVSVTGSVPFTLNYTGAAPDPNTIMITFWADNRKYSLAEILTNIVDDGVQIDGLYNWSKFGNKVIKTWDYLSANDNINGKPQLKKFYLDNIDNMRTELLASPPTAEYILNGTDQEPYKSLLRVLDLAGADYAVIKSTQEGLGLKTYQSDLFNNWLSTEWIDGTGGINEITSIDTSSGSFNIDAIVLASKVYKMLNRIAVSGGSYDDWLNAVYDHDPTRRTESPMYMGGLIKELVFQEVVSNSEGTGDGGNQPLGTLAGKGVMGQKHKGGSVVIKVDEPSYIMGIISLTPRIDYSQGNKWDVTLDTMDDLHKPSLDEIGFQELITEQMAWFSTRKPMGVPTWETKSAGKQPAWINYMTNVNKVYGSFADQNDSMFMVLNRRYSHNKATGRLSDGTTYIDPTKFNQIFAQTSIDSQNFWVQISCDIITRRKMSAKVIPNL